MLSGRVVGPVREALAAGQHAETDAERACAAGLRHACGARVDRTQSPRATKAEVLDVAHAGLWCLIGCTLMWAMAALVDGLFMRMTMFAVAAMTLIPGGPVDWALGQGGWLGDITSGLVVGAVLVVLVWIALTVRTVLRGPHEAA